MELDNIVAVMFLAIGSAFLIRTAWDVASGILSRRWPQTDGVIVGARLEEQDDGEGLSYRPAVTYRYSVEGREFVGSRTRYGMDPGWLKSARRMLRKYPYGATVAVRYNPRNPGEAVLEPGPNGTLLIGGVFGAVFVACGIAALRGSP